MANAQKYQVTLTDKVQPGIQTVSLKAGARNTLFSRTTANGRPGPGPKVIPLSDAEVLAIRADGYIVAPEVKAGAAPPAKATPAESAPSTTPPGDSAATGGVK